MNYGIMKNGVNLEESHFSGFGNISDSLFFMFA